MHSFVQSAEKTRPVCLRADPLSLYVLSIDFVPWFIGVSGYVPVYIYVPVYVPSLLHLSVVFLLLPDNTSVR